MFSGNVLIDLLVLIVVIGAMFGICKYMLPEMGTPPGVIKAVQIVIIAIFIICLIYILVPLLRGTAIP